jgi:uncharacterized protein YjbI with pentapeptide repeats/energy-coupling factor transporter ATP-binding protein EcfA2
MIEPRRAVVRPRVYSGDAAFPLEDEIAARLEARSYGVVELCGERGVGKSTALAHLAALFAHEPALVVADGPLLAECDELAAAARDHLVVYVSHEHAVQVRDPERLRLAAWSEDDWIEYLLAVHESRCASVLGRLRRDPGRRQLGGATVLHRIVLDELARNESLVDVDSAFRSALKRFLGEAYAATAEACCRYLTTSAGEGVVFEPMRRIQLGSPKTVAMLRQPVVRMLLAGEHVVAGLRAGDIKLLKNGFSAMLLERAAQHLRGDEAVLDRLRLVADFGNPNYQPMAISLLHYAGDAWKPRGGEAPRLRGAHLPKVCWPGVRFSALDIRGADLTGADLNESQLSDVEAAYACLAGADLRGAKIEWFEAPCAQLSGANLSNVRASDVDLCGATLRAADLQGAVLVEARLTEADLSGACLRRADLKSADLRSARIDGADFTGVDLTRAKLSNLDLRSAEFSGATFSHALMQNCNLEGMILPGASFVGAELTGAHLTGSEMPHANFENAELRVTGLAGIEWEKANLRNADLRGATFHMGSSRSGLVANPPASEGTRTGFYTDEYEEQGFKSPEEIRKANLCGADLRGANLGDVDFYLVDLRGAFFTESQAKHLLRCGAILESRV